MSHASTARRGTIVTVGRRRSVSITTPCTRSTAAKESYVCPCCCQAAAISRRSSRCSSGSCPRKNNAHDSVCEVVSCPATSMSAIVKTMSSAEKCSTTWPSALGSDSSRSRSRRSRESCLTPDARSASRCSMSADTKTRTYDAVSIDASTCALRKTFHHGNLTASDEKISKVALTAARKRVTLASSAVDAGLNELKRIESAASPITSNVTRASDSTASTRATEARTPGTPPDHRDSSHAEHIGKIDSLTTLRRYDGRITPVSAALRCACHFGILLMNTMPMFLKRRSAMGDSRRISMAG
eukprot:Amastigsp_a340822_147.p2 type:complete len:299 gc:universal Amastigsp_a340822_147:1292-396(-)